MLMPSFDWKKIHSTENLKKIEGKSSLNSNKMFPFLEHI